MKIFAITMTPINPPYDDGPKNIMLGVARRIKEHDFYFISSVGKCFGPEENITFIRSPFQKPGRHSMTILQKAFIFFTTIFNMKKIDVFQFFFTPRPYFSKIYRNLLKKNNKKSVQVISSIHTLFDKNTKESIPSLFFADYVVVHSDYSGKVLSDMGVKNIVRIYPGIELARFNADKVNADSNFNIIYPGTYKILDESYSFDKFCEIASTVRDKNDKARFIMACRIRTGEDRILENKFKAAVERHGLKNIFVLLRTVDNMPELFNKCAAGIMPAARPMKGILEIPLVLLELSALGKPVLYSNVPPLDEIAKAGIGIKVAGPGPISYAEILIKLLADERTVLETGERSKEAVKKYFNMDRVAGEYQKLYENLRR